jgi:hypothetical protein
MGGTGYAGNPSLTFQWVSKVFMRPTKDLPILFFFGKWLELTLAIKFPLAAF